ncbi:MAG TPA: alcohol dehydrogenase catalytic domain-containing protein [Vicinamibacterales bacterium]|nr:alcohol dehydrogenase catalytic domain-containing protein [Vicinamibacterales bacterium]
MRALALDGIVRFRADYPKPSPSGTDVLVRVLTAGVCETDLQLIKGYMGYRGVLGHEFVGVAENGPLAGRRVVGEINCACGACDLCARELPTHCVNRTVLGIANHDGAFADYLVVPQRNLHPVPDPMPTEIAVFTEPVAAAFQILVQLNVARTDRVIVLGDGRLGNLCAQVLARVAADTLVIGKHPEKLALLQRLGIRTALLAEAPTDRRADVVVECTGSESGLPAAISLVRPRGTIVLKTTVAGTQTMPWASFVIDEITLIGSRCGPFDRALVALEHGEVDVRPLIQERLPLERGVDALNLATQRLKVLLTVNEG